MTRRTRSVDRIPYGFFHRMAKKAEATNTGKTTTNAISPPDRATSSGLPDAPGEPTRLPLVERPPLVNDAPPGFASIVPQADPECGGHVDLPCVGSPIVHDIADAVGQMTFEDDGSSYVCTGTLLNVGDTPDVFEPYFMTANHCVGTDTVAATAKWHGSGSVQPATVSQSILAGLSRSEGRICLRRGRRKIRRFSSSRRSCPEG